MSHELEPKVGRWYRRLDDDELFKVVSIDEDDGLIEIKGFDGELEELDATEWIELDLETAEAPEDYLEPDEDEDEDEDDEPEAADEDRPARGAGRRSSRDDWEEDDEDDDWDDDDDDDEDDDYDDDSER